MFAAGGYIYMPVDEEQLVAAGPHGLLHTSFNPSSVAALSEVGAGSMSSGTSSGDSDSADDDFTSGGSTSDEPNMVFGASPNGDWCDGFGVFGPFADGPGDGELAGIVTAPAGMDSPFSGVGFGGSPADFSSDTATSDGDDELEAPPPEYYDMDGGGFIDADEFRKQAPTLLEQGLMTTFGNVIKTGDLLYPSMPLHLLGGQGFVQRQPGPADVGRAEVAPASAVAVEGRPRSPSGVSLYDSTFSITVWRLYDGAKGLVMWYYLRGAARARSCAGGGHMDRQRKPSHQYSCG
jgi:hypothetical protein